MDDEDRLSSQAHRLLRERWKSAEALSQELYAMLLPDAGGIDREEPQAASRPPDVAARESEAAKKLEVTQAIQQRNRIVEALEREGPAWQTPSQAGYEWQDRIRSEETRAEYARSNIRADQSPFLVSGGNDSPSFFQPTQQVLAQPLILSASGLFSGVNFPVGSVGSASIAANPVILSNPSWIGDMDAPPNPADPRSPKVRFPYIPFPVQGGTDTFLGKVVSGDGDRYQVELYPDGKEGEPGDTVEVRIPQIDTHDSIPEDTWIAPVLHVTNDAGDDEYWYQPQIWLA